MKRIVLSVVVSAMVFCGFAAIDGYKWKKDSNGSWSGCVTDPEHWPNGVVPENNAATGLGGTFAVEGDRVVCTPAVLPGIMLFLR